MMTTKVQLVTLAVALLQSFAQVSHADLINDKLPKGNSDSHRRQKRENERQLQTKLIGDVQVLVKDPGFREEDKQKSSTVWPTTLPPRILQDHFAIKSHLGPQIRPSKVLKTDYTTFTYFITSLLGSGETTTSTDIIISSNVITENAPVSPTAPWDLQSSRLSYNEIKIPSSLGFTSRTFYTKIPSGLQVTTKTYFTTSTLYSTYFQNGRTYTKTRTIVRSEILEDTPFTQASSPSLVSGQEDDVKYLSLGSNIYGKIKTLFATYTYTTTNLLGQVGPSTRVITQVSTSVFSSSNPYKKTKIQLSPDQLASLKLSYLQSNQQEDSSKGSYEIQSGQINHQFGSGQVVQGGDYQVLGSGGSQGGSSGQSGNGVSGQYGSGQSGQSGSDTSGQYGGGASSQSGSGGSGTSGQYGSGASGQSGSGGSNISGQYGSGSSSQSGNGGNSASSQYENGVAGQNGVDGGNNISGQYGSGSSSQSGSGVSGQYGSGVSSQNGGNEGNNISGQYGSGSSSQSGSGTSGESGSGISGQYGSGSSGSNGSGGSGSSGQHGSGTLGSNGSGGSGSSGQYGSGTSGSNGSGGSGTSGQSGGTEGSSNHGTGGIYESGQHGNNGQSSGQHGGSGNSEQGSGQNGSSSQANGGNYGESSSSGGESSSIGGYYPLGQGTGGASGQTGHGQGSSSHNGGINHSSSSHGSIYVEDNEYHETTGSHANKTSSKPTNTHYESTTHSSVITTKPIKPSGVYLDPHYLSSLKSSFLSSSGSSSTSESSSPIWDVNLPTSGPVIISPPGTLDPSIVTVTETFGSPAASVSPSGTDSGAQNGGSPGSPDSSAAYPSSGGGGVINAVVGGIAEGLGGVFGGGNENVGLKVDLGPVLDAVATLLRGPIRSAIANRRSDIGEPSSSRDFKHIPRHTQVFVSELTTIPFAQRNIQARHNNYEFVPLQNNNNNNNARVDGIAPRSDDSPALHVPKEIFDEINKHRTFKDEPVYLDKNKLIINDHVIHTNDPYIIDVLNRFEQGHLFGEVRNKPMAIKILPGEQIHGSTGNTIDQQEIQKILSEEQVRNNALNAKRPRVPPPTKKHLSKHSRPSITNYRNPSLGPNKHIKSAPFPGKNPGHRVAGQKARLQVIHNGRIKGHTKPRQPPPEQKNPPYPQFNVESPKVNYNRQLHGKRNHHGQKRPKFSDIYPGGPNQNGFKPNFRPHPKDHSQGISAKPGVGVSKPLFPYTKHSKEPHGYHKPPLPLKNQKPPRPTRGSVPPISNPKRPKKQTPQPLNKPQTNKIRPRPPIQSHPNGFAHRPIRPRLPHQNPNIKQPNFQDQQHHKRLPRPRPTGYIRGGGRPNNVSPNADIIEETEVREGIEFGFTPKVNNPFLRPGIVEDANLTRYDYNPNERIHVIKGSINPQHAKAIRPSSSSKNKLIATGYGVIVDGNNVREMTITDSYGGIQVIQTKVQDVVYNIDQTGLPLRPPAPKVSKLDYQGWNTQQRESASVIRPTSSFSFDSSLKKEAPKTVTYANEWSVYRPDQSSVINFVPQKRPTLNTNFDREWTVRDTVRRPSKASAFFPRNTKGYNNEWSEVRPYNPNIYSDPLQSTQNNAHQEQSSLISHQSRRHSIAANHDLNKHQSPIQPTTTAQSNIESTQLSAPIQSNHQSSLRDSNTIINGVVKDNQSFENNDLLNTKKNTTPNLKSQAQNTHSIILEPSLSEATSNYLTTKRSIAKGKQPATLGPEESLNPINEPDYGTFINVNPPRPHSTLKPTVPLPKVNSEGGSFINAHPSASAPEIQESSPYNVESEAFISPPSKKNVFERNTVVDSKVSLKASNNVEPDTGTFINIYPSSSSIRGGQSSKVAFPGIEPDTGTFINIYPSSSSIQKEAEPYIEPDTGTFINIDPSSTSSIRGAESSSLSPDIEPDTGTFINIYPSIQRDETSSISQDTRSTINPSSSQKKPFSFPRKTSTYTKNIRPSAADSLQETPSSKLPPGIEPDTGTFINIFPSSTSKRAQATEYYGYVDSDTIRRGNENQANDGEFGVKIAPYDDERVFENDYQTDGNVFYNSYNYDGSAQGSNNFDLHANSQDSSLSTVEAGSGVTPSYQEPPALVIDLTGRPTFENKHSNLHDNSQHTRTHKNTLHVPDQNSKSQSSSSSQVSVENPDSSETLKAKNQRRPVRKISQGPNSNGVAPFTTFSNNDKHNLQNKDQSFTAENASNQKKFASTKAPKTKELKSTDPSRVHDPTVSGPLFVSEVSTTEDSLFNKDLDLIQEIDVDGPNKEETHQEQVVIEDLLDVHFTTGFEIIKTPSTTTQSAVTQDKYSTSKNSKERINNNDSLEIIKTTTKSFVTNKKTTTLEVTKTTKSFTEKSTTYFAPTTIKSRDTINLSTDFQSKDINKQFKNHGSGTDKSSQKPEVLYQPQFENTRPSTSTESIIFKPTVRNFNQNHGSIYLRDPNEALYENNNPYQYENGDYDYSEIAKQYEAEQPIGFQPSDDGKRRPHSYPNNPNYDQYDWIPTDGINVPGEPFYANPDYFNERNDKHFYDVQDYDGDANNFNKIVVEGKNDFNQGSNDILKELLKDAEDTRASELKDSTEKSVELEKKVDSNIPEATTTTSNIPTKAQKEKSSTTEDNDNLLGNNVVAQKQPSAQETKTTPATSSTIPNGPVSVNVEFVHDGISGGDGGSNDGLHAIDNHSSDSNGSIYSINEHSNVSTSTISAEVTTTKTYPPVSSSTENNGLLPGIPNYDAEYGSEYGEWSYEDTNAGNILNLDKIEGGYSASNPKQPPKTIESTKEGDDNRGSEFVAHNTNDYVDIITGQTLKNTADIRYVGSDSFRRGETSPTNGPSSNEGNIYLVNGEHPVENGSVDAHSSLVDDKNDKIVGVKEESSVRDTQQDLHDNLGNIIVINGSKKTVHEASSTPAPIPDTFPPIKESNDETLVIIGPQKPPKFEPSPIDAQRKPLVVYGPQENPNKIRRTTPTPGNHNFIGPLRFNPNFIGPFKLHDQGQNGLPPPPEGFEFVGPVVHGPVRFNPKKPEDIILKTQFNSRPEIITGVPAPTIFTSRNPTSFTTQRTTTFTSRSPSGIIVTRNPSTIITRNPSTYITRNPSTYITRNPSTLKTRNPSTFITRSSSESIRITSPATSSPKEDASDVSNDEGRKSGSRYKVNIKPTNRPIIDLFNRKRSSTTVKPNSPSLSYTTPISFSSKFSPKYSVIRRSTTPSPIITSSREPSKKIAGFFIPRNDKTRSKIEKVYPNKDASNGLAFDGNSNSISSQTDAPGIIRDQTLNNIDGAIVESIPGHSLTAEETDPETRCQNACGENEVCQIKSDRGVICKCRPGFGRVEGSSVKCGKSKSFEIEVITTSESEAITIVKLSPKAVEKAVADSYRKNIKDLYFGSQITSIKVGNNTKRNVFFGGEKNLTRDDEMSFNMIVHIADDGQNSTEEVLKSVLETPIKDTKLPLGADVTVSRVTIEDFDECAHKDHNDCSDQAVCHNIKGSYTCSCKEGYHDLSGPEILSGRVCLATTTACDLCNGNGNCIAGEVVTCECQPWFAGKNCQINMKLLLIVGCVSVGLMLVIACGVSCFCCKDGRSAALRNKQNSIPSPYGTGIAPMPPMRGHGILMDPHGTMKSRAFVPKPYAIRPKRSKKSSSSAGGSSFNGSTSAAGGGGSWQAAAAAYSGISGADSTTSKQSRKSGGALSSGIEALNPAVLIPRAKVKPKLFEDFLSEDEASSSPEANRALSEHTSLASRHRRRSIPFIIRSSRSERGGSVDPLLDGSFSDDSASRTLRGNHTLRSVASETFEVPVLHSNTRIMSGSISVRSSRSHATSDGGRIMAERDGGSSFVISASRSHQLYRLHGSDGSLDSL